MFITFEGIEGCGKTTQAKLLYQWLLDRGEKVTLTREPGGTPAAEEIRELLLKERDEKFPPFSELCLYLAARGFHTENLIRPLLKEGAFVICDRFTDSTLAYQGYGRGIEIDLIEKMNKEATGGLKPQLTFLIDLPVEVAFERIKDRKKDRLERESLEFHRRVREGFLEIAKRERDRIVVLNGTKPADEIFQEVKEEVLRRRSAL